MELLDVHLHIAQADAGLFCPHPDQTAGSQKPDSAGIPSSLLNSDLVGAVVPILDSRAHRIRVNIELTLPGGYVSCDKICLACRAGRACQSQPAHQTQPCGCRGSTAVPINGFLPLCFGRHCCVMTRGYPGLCAGYVCLLSEILPSRG